MLPLTIVRRRYFESVSLRFPNGSFLTRRLERAGVAGLRFIWFAGRALRCPDWHAVKMPHFCTDPDHEGGAAAKSGAMVRRSAVCLGSGKRFRLWARLREEHARSATVERFGLIAQQHGWFFARLDDNAADGAIDGDKFTIDEHGCLAVCA